MKLSEMSTEKVADILMVIAPEIQPILLDGDIMKELQKDAANKEKAPEEISSQGVLETIRQLQELFRDQELIGFFTPSKPAARSK